jgi:hypothetical protein
MPHSEVREQAMRIFELTKNQHWSIFFRDVFGLNGLIHKSYPTREVRSDFMQSTEYWDIVCMLAGLWEEPGIQSGERRVVITLRVPQSMHDLLKEEARELHTTINGLCIAKLISDINPDTVPRA